MYKKTDAMRDGITTLRNAARLRDELHIVPRSAMSKHDESPYIIAPEQVILLVQHGYGRVRTLKRLPPCTSEQGHISGDESSSESGEEPVGAVVAGRNTKALEKNGTEDDCSATKQKTTKRDIARFETSRKQISEAVSPKRKAESSEDAGMVNLMKINCDEEIYQWLDEFDIPVPCTREFRARQLVYYDLWSRGYYLTSGEQFGTTWLVYEGAPGDVHAAFLVDFMLDDQVTGMSSLIALIRVAVQVKKTMVLAVVSSDRIEPHYITMDWPTVGSHVITFRGRMNSYCIVETV
ncbi:unnamed protein product [Haemonchus placei]|uniref:tRNA-intron lyase n=1 Tax=Haemonchus placei TaxID=6290 RepID=A0A3P7Y801_HAEPC|nr:unnamed protein product [Haemonchus placei]